MDFIQTIKAEHAKATDVIDKLADTSTGAVKTRERLLGQLRTLLEAHAQKEEVYLYPALQDRDEARDFLDGARPAHGEMDRLLGELDAMPKDDEGFLPRLAELRRIVEPHARAEERLLPALRRAMAEDEVRALDDAIAGRPDEAEVAAAQASQAAYESGALLRQGAMAAGEGAQRFAQDAATHAERTRQSVLTCAEIYGETARLTAEDLQAIATCSSVAAGGMSEMRHAWMDWLNRTLRAGARASQEALRCATIEQMAEVQRSFMAESMETLLEGSAQMLRISSRIAEEARRPIEARVLHPARRGETAADRPR